MATNEFKVRLYRLVSDLVKYDSVVSSKELDMLDDIISQYDISSLDRKASYAVTLAEAISYFAHQPSRIQSKVLRILEDCAMTDGECSREEALLLSAFEVTTSGKGGVISIPLKNRPILSSQLLYIDSKYTLKSNELDKDFDRMSDIAALAGFELIYIPQLAREFRTSKNPDYLKKLLCMINPTLETSSVESKIKSLCEMDSPFFYKQVLNDKLQMGLDINAPSWLIRLKDSSVNGIGYANFLHYKIDMGNMCGQLKSYISNLNSRVRSYSIVVNRPRENSFEFPYDGFHKALIDVIALEKIADWEIKVYVRAGANSVISKRDNSRRYSVEICRGEQSYPICINGREAALYLLLLCASAGPDKSADFEYERDRSKVLQAQYEDAYRVFSNREAHTPDITRSDTFRPAKSKIISKLMDSGLIEDLHLFKPTKKMKNSYYIPLPSKYVKIVSTEGETPLCDSSVFKRFLNIK